MAHRDQSPDMRDMRKSRRLLDVLAYLMFHLSGTDESGKLVQALLYDTLKNSPPLVKVLLIDAVGDSVLTDMSCLGDFV